MLKELKKLEELQKFDSLIFQKEEELDHLPEENEKLKGNIVEMEDKLKELNNSISIQEEERKKREEILKKGEDKLKTITGKQSAIRNKEEYNSLLREIDNIKRFNRELEEEINEINREIEIKLEELNLIEEDSKKKIIEHKSKMEDNDSRIENLEKEIDDIFEKRDKVAENIRPAIRRKYERILENSPNGHAVATAKDYICSGCNMTLPPQLFNNVLKSEKIEMCPNCQRILLPDESYLQDKSE